MMNNNLLSEGIAAIKSGDKLKGRRLLAQLVQQKSSNEMGWLWLSTCVDSVDQKKHCLNEVLRINPKNQDALDALDRLETTVEAPKLDDIVPPKPASTPTTQISDNAVILPKSMARFASPSNASSSQSQIDTNPVVNAHPTSVNSMPKSGDKGFIDQNLMPDEQVVYRTHVHWVIFLNILTPLLIAIGVMILISVWNASLSKGLGKTIKDLFSGIFVLGDFILVIVVAPLILLQSLIYSKTREFAVTNKRVLIKWGFIQRHSMEVLLKQVEGITVFQPVMGRLFGYGTIRVTGTGGTNEPFRLISQPLEFRRQVQRQIETLNK